MEIINKTRHRIEGAGGIKGFIALMVAEVEKEWRVRKDPMLVVDPQILLQLSRQRRIREELREVAPGKERRDLMREMRSSAEEFDKRLKEVPEEERGQLVMAEIKAILAGERD